MIKLISIILFTLIFVQGYNAQQKLFGYKTFGTDDIVSDAFLIQDGFVLDSVTTIIYGSSKTYRFEYDTNGRLKKDINFISYFFVSDNGILIQVPGCRSYLYNEKGDVDSIAFSYWNDTLQVYSSMGGTRYDYSYNSEGKMLSKTSSGNRMVEENSYDSYGNLILNKVIRYGDTTYNIREYDSHNRLILTKSIHGNSPWYDQNVYKYDSVGNINCTTQSVSPSYIFNAWNNYLEFDESGRVVNEIRSSQFNSADSTWFTNYQILFNYDEYNRIFSMGIYSLFRYNADGNIDTLLNPPLPSNGSYLSNRATLIDFYGNEITLPDYHGYCCFYYSRLITSVSTNEIKDKTFTLLQNYPNPFNPTTNFEFRISNFPARGTSGFVSLKIYDVLGNEVAGLVNEEKSPGVYSIKFDASELASGVYFYQLKAGNFIDTKKMLLLK